MRSNNALERTVIHRGRIVLARNCVLADAQWRLWPAARGRWSVWVNGNWRVTFEFKDGHAYVLDYEDYH